MAEKKLPTPQPTPPGVSVVEEQTSTTPPKGGTAPTKEGAQPTSMPHHEKALKAARDLGIDDSHALHLEAVARAAGGKNWGALLDIFAGLIKVLKDSGILNQQPTTNDTK
jgi:hypothetical protein